jgi:tetratricopeptide (TPR) repeat protein
MTLIVKPTAKRAARQTTNHPAIPTARLTAKKAATQSVIQAASRIALLIPLLTVVILAIASSAVRAIESTAHTYTRGIDLYYVRTQNAYIPSSIILRELNMRSPEDLHIVGKTMYIADTGNKRLVRFQMESGKVDFLGVGLLKQPTGVSVFGDGRIVVADYGARAILILNPDGDKVLQTIGRPDALLYGESTAYKPRKVAVDSYGNIYATSEGTHEGILQFDASGTFAGFFGANKASRPTLRERIEDLIFTKEQRQQQPLRNPLAVVNVSVSTENLVYSVTQYNPKEALKKLNMAGINTMDSKIFLGEPNFVDVTIGKNGEMFAVTDTGAITEYDKDGRYLFAFGGRAVSSDRNGLTSVVSSIAVDDEYNVFVLDKHRGVVQPHAPTDFANDIHKGLAHYQEGRYAEALSIWREFLRLTPRASFAHWGYGLALWQIGDYAEAKYHLELVRDFGYASDAFWELRNAWLMDHLPVVIIALVALWLVLSLVGVIRKRRDFLRPALEAWHRLSIRYRLISDLAYMRQMIYHPVDALYELKAGARGSILAASVLYALALVVWLADSILTAPLFNTMRFSATWANPVVITGMAIIPAVLFVIGNYFISSINDGEGSFRNVFIVVAYALSFYIILTPFTTILSHALTLNEAFVHRLLKLVISGYTLVLVFTAAKETHGYSVGGTVKNLALTLCFMVLASAAMAVLYMMWSQLIGFVATLAEEVRLRG